MIMRMGIFIGCGYGSETGIGVSTLKVMKLPLATILSISIDA
jgi:hypothetical protein